MGARLSSLSINWCGVLRLLAEGERASVAYDAAAAIAAYDAAAAIAAYEPPAVGK